MSPRRRSTGAGRGTARGLWLAGAAESKGQCEYTNLTFTCFKSSHEPEIRGGGQTQNQNAQGSLQDLFMEQGKGGNRTRKNSSQCTNEGFWRWSRPEATVQIKQNSLSSQQGPTRDAQLSPAESGSRAKRSQKVRWSGNLLGDKTSCNLFYCDLEWVSWLNTF